MLTPLSWDDRISSLLYLVDLGLKKAELSTSIYIRLSYGYYFRFGKQYNFLRASNLLTRVVGMVLSKWILPFLRK